MSNFNWENNFVDENLSLDDIVVDDTTDNIMGSADNNVDNVDNVNIVSDNLTSDAANVAAAKITAMSTDAKKTHSNSAGDIDPNIHVNDMMTLLHSEIKERGIAGHHIDSMNNFLRIGIQQIVTELFSVEGRVKNQRDRTEEDREIVDVAFKVEFTGINITPPTTTKYKSGAPQLLTPNMARLKNLTYSSGLFIDAAVSATATYKDGKTKTRSETIKNQRIASIPVMVGSELCNTYGCSKDALKRMMEDPNDINGYFIVKGGEWVVDNLENVRVNYPQIHRNAWLDEIARAQFLSKPGDWYDNSYQIIIRYKTNGAITIELTINKSDKFEIPFYILFRALGMTRDVEILNHIVFGVNNTDAITKYMMKVLERALEVDDAKFGALKRNYNPLEIISFITGVISEAAKSANAQKDENVAKHLNNNFLTIIDRYIFPHVGVGPEYRIRKLRYLGYLINQLIQVEMGILASTDRDSFGNKRIHSAGTSMAKAFKTNFNFTIVQEVRKHMIRVIKATPFSQIPLAETVKQSINSDELERHMIQTITSGSKTVTKGNTEFTHRVSTQTLYRKNMLNAKSTLRSISTPDTGASKQNERADQMRRVHPSAIGYVDVSQSADTGEKVGMTKQMGISATISGASSSYALKKRLLSDPDVMPLDDVAPEQITAQKLALIFVNGDWIGFCRDAYMLAHKYRVLRREGLEVHPQASIVTDPLTREIKFWTDVGRMLRPLVIVYNNLEEYNAAYKDGRNYIDSSGPRAHWNHPDGKMVEKVPFMQWIKLTKQHLIGLQSGNITMNDLVKDQIIEYIAPEEQENCYVAPNITTLRSRASDMEHQYTHMDVDQAIFGVVTLASPLANHSNSVRNCMYTNHRKQSTGWFTLNWPYRIDKNTFLQYYCEMPLVKCFTDNITYPNGTNCMVALMLHDGYNCEDSLQINQSSIDAGMFNGSRFYYEKTELEKGEQFGNTDYARTMDIKKDANYEFIVNGLVKIGTVVHKNDVLIVKTAKLSQPSDGFLYVDKSIIYKSEEPAIVENVIVTRNSDDVMTAKVKLRSIRPLIVGDKLSSRTGNKGIVARTVPRNRMPYNKDGVTPDILVNAHSIPTRMAINQIIEIVLARYAAETGCVIDATCFKDIDLDEVLKKLADMGIANGGHDQLYNGVTGEWIDTLIFMGPNSYQRLQKFVIDEHYSTRTGPTAALTRQPLDGSLNEPQVSISCYIIIHYKKYNNEVTPSH